MWILGLKGLKYFRCERRNSVCNPSNVDLFVCEDNAIFTYENMFSRKSLPV